MMCRCSYCNAPGATKEITWVREGIEHTMFIVCENQAACRERENDPRDGRTTEAKHL